MTAGKFRCGAEGKRLCLISESAKYNLGHLPWKTHLFGSLGKQAVWQVSSLRIITFHWSASLKGL